MGGNDEIAERVGEGEVAYDQDRMRKLLGEEKKKKMLEDSKTKAILEKIEREEAQLIARLSDPFRSRFIQAKLLGLERQAEIAMIEGLTGTVLMNLDEQHQIIYRDADLRLGYTIGNFTEIPHGNALDRLVKDHPNRLDEFPLRKYLELKNFFDEIRIHSAPYSAHDAFMYGVKGKGSNQMLFLITRSDANGWR